jgi:hypothetical protein
MDENPSRFEPGDRPMSTSDLAAAGEPQVPDEKLAPAAQRSSATPLLPENEVSELHRRWDEIQTGFVDEPRRSVEDADALVAAAMKRLAEMFASERAGLEQQWDQGDNVSTEDLRLALQRYRAFFGRLLAV